MARCKAWQAWMPVALGMAVCLPALSPAQAIPGNSLANPAQAAPAALGGRSSLDILSFRSGIASAPLRHGGVVPGSDRVMLDGRVLQRGLEYAIDNEAGVVYLMLVPRQGQTVTAAYRYTPGSSATAAPAFAGPRPFSFAVAPGSLNMLMGLGLTERTAEGAVLTSNVYGLNNSFAYRGGSLKGLYLVGDREQARPASAYEYQAEVAVPDAGRSQAILQSLQAGFLGGQIEADLQDISKNFNGFAAMREGGLDQAALDQLAKERGLKRMALGFKDIQLGGLGFSHSVRKVGDERNGLEWRSLGLASGGFQLNWRSQKVDQGFNRFKDLREADREQLAREAGLRREWMEGSWKTGLGALSFVGSLVEDGNSKGISRQEIKLDSSKLKFAVGEQEVEQGFTRFDSLFEPERGQWGREAGLKRQWRSLEAALFGTGVQPLRFASHKISSQTGAFDAMDASASGKGWSLEHAKRSVDKGFAALGNLPQPELDAHINAISNMYVKGGVPLRPEERGWFLQSPGLERAFTRFQAQPFKNWNLGFETLSLKGKEDAARVDSAKLDGKGLSAYYRRQNLGAKFNELTTLMEFERQRLGTMAGLERTDLGFCADLSRGKLDYAQTDAAAPQGSFARKSLKYADRSLQIAVNQREIHPGFSAIGQMLDPEQNMLPALLGFKQTDAQLKWQILPNLRVEAMGFRGEHDALQRDQLASNMLVYWAPNPATQLEYLKNESKLQDPLSVLFSNSTERMALTRQLGRYGTLHLAQTKVEFHGTQATQPDSIQRSFAYETNLDERTKIRTEQSRTQFDNGDKEDVSANTISTEVAKGVGINLTDVNIDRRGKQRDEKKLSVGGWLDLGHGVRLNYGIIENANHLGSSTGQSNISLTPGTMGNVQIASASYNANKWEQNDRVQAMSAIGLSTVKPFRLGPLDDVKLSFSHETAADQGKWLKENRGLSFNGRLGKYALGFEYRGQMDNAENRAVDRAFSFSTPNDPKSRLLVSAFYKHRTLPDGDTAAIRNWTVTARPAKGLELQHQLTTNPEAPRGDVLLGSVVQPLRSNKWKLDWVSGPNCRLSGSWEELRNDQNDALSRIGGITLTLFEAKGSPLTLFYGAEQMDGNVPKRTVDRWSLSYNQRPGPNQVFSLVMGNVSYGYTLANGEQRHNLNVTLEYQLRF